MTPMDLLTERALVWAFSAFESRSTLQRKVVGTVVLVPVGALYCAGLIFHAIWTEGERG
jgi:hypothetical protein